MVLIFFKFDILEKELQLVFNQNFANKKYMFCKNLYPIEIFGLGEQNGDPCHVMSLLMRTFPNGLRNYLWTSIHLIQTFGPFLELKR